MLFRFVNDATTLLIQHRSVSEWVLLSVANANRLIEIIL
jgi:hypothetical protein